MIEYLIGDTLKMTWVNSSASSPVGSWSIFTGSETALDTGSMVDSGNGHLYNYYTLPNTPGLYVAETIVTYSGYPFKRRQKFRIITDEVD